MTGRTRMYEGRKRIQRSIPKEGRIGKGESRPDRKEKIKGYKRGRNGKEGQGKKKGMRKHIGIHKR